MMVEYEHRDTENKALEVIRKNPIPNNEQFRICEQEIREKTLDDLINWIRIADDDSCNAPWTFKEINKTIIDFGKEVKREELRQRNGEVKKDE